MKLAPEINGRGGLAPLDRGARCKRGHHVVCHWRQHRSVCVRRQLGLAGAPRLALGGSHAPPCVSALPGGGGLFFRGGLSADHGAEVFSAVCVASRAEAARFPRFLAANTLQRAKDFRSIQGGVSLQAIHLVRLSCVTA